MKRPRRNTEEHQTQVRLLGILTYAMRPELRVIAIPNQGKRSIITGRAMKAEGLTAGVADLLFMFPADEGSVGWLEMKAKKGSMKDTQHGFHAICDRLGHRWAMARSVHEALVVLRGWNALRPNVVIE
jgi:hypothetical protein